MGDNGNHFSYIVGFGDNYPAYSHHRNLYRTDLNDLEKEQAKLPKIDKNYKFAQIGYLVGGSRNNGEYNDDINNYSGTEGGIDYNAGLVGALGYINSKINPVSEPQNIKETISEAKQCVLSPNPTQDYLNIYIKNMSVGEITVEVINTMGSVCKRETMTGKKLTLNVSGLAKGMYLVRVVSGDEIFTKQIIKK